MDFATFVNAFDLFADCFVYGSVAYIISLFTISLALAFVALIDEHQALKQAAEQDSDRRLKELKELFNSPLLNSSLESSPATNADRYQATEPDFYQQVKELLNPCTEQILDVDSNLSFAQMTLRELRQYIKDNQLQQHIRLSLGKTVSNARKLELVRALS